MTDMASPFISFVVFSYNQEDFIRDAVEGALSQQCMPLEIILSDDCSTDDTFSIIQEMAAAYAGPHQISVRQNESNLGLIDHINTVFELARGEWIVVAAGDDISMPNRVAEIARVIVEHPDINMVSSALIAMDEQGNRKSESCVFRSADEEKPANVVIAGLTELIEHRAPYVHGATLAYSKKLIKAFPIMPENAVYEDAIFRFRSALLGARAHINQPLVLYRKHPNQTTNVSFRPGRKLYERKKTLAIGGYTTARQLLDDMRSVSDIDSFRYKSLERFQRCEYEYRKVLYRLIVWPWPLRFVYSLGIFIREPGIISSLRRSDIACICFPVVALSVLSVFFAIGVE